MHSLACKHEFCKQCVTDHLSNSIKNGSALKLFCMETGCIEKYTEEHVEMFCPDKLLEVYKKVQSEVQGAVNKKLRKCPAVDCDSVIS